MYYNSVPEPNAIATHHLRVAAKQESEVLELFRRHRRLSPSQAFLAMGKRYPITSIRRAIHDLEDAGKLSKTGDKVLGMYGRNENIWQTV